MTMNPINSETLETIATPLEAAVEIYMPRISRKEPVSPGTANLAIVPYIKAHNPRPAIYSQVSGITQLGLRVPGKQSPSLDWLLKA
jgi:hypothetical protein